jgi:hypothetical protein
VNTPTYVANFGNLLVVVPSIQELILEIAGLKAPDRPNAVYAALDPSLDVRSLKLFFAGKRYTDTMPTKRYVGVTLGDFRNQAFFRNPNLMERWQRAYASKGILQLAADQYFLRPTTYDIFDYYKPDPKATYNQRDSAGFSYALTNALANLMTANGHLPAVSKDQRMEERKTNEIAEDLTDIFARISGKAVINAGVYWIASGDIPYAEIAKELAGDELEELVKRIPALEIGFKYLDDIMENAAGVLPAVMPLMQVPGTLVMQGFRFRERVLGEWFADSQEATGQSDNWYDPDEEVVDER